MKFNISDDAITCPFKLAYFQINCISECQIDIFLAVLKWE